MSTNQQNNTNENDKVISVYSGYVNAKDFYDGVRGLERMFIAIKLGIDDMNPYDKFFITMARHLYETGSIDAEGTANSVPDDVRLILERLFSKSEKTHH